MDPNVRKIIRYLIAMVAIFLIVCLIAIIKNWSVLISYLGGSLTSILIILIISGIIINMILSVFRR